jgi:hypothetical protein
MQYQIGGVTAHSGAEGQIRGSGYEDSVDFTSDKRESFEVFEASRDVASSEDL